MIEALFETYDGVGVAILRDTAVVLWDAPSRAARVRWVFEVVTTKLLDSGEGALVCQLILPSSTPPDTYARAASRELFAAHGNAIRRMVTVPLGDALWITVVRAIMRSIFVVYGDATVHRIASSEEEAIHLLHERATRRTPSVVELQSMIDELHRALGVQRQRPT